MSNELSSQVADAAKDIAGSISGSPLSQAKLGLKVGCLLGSILLITSLLFFITGLNNPGADEAAAAGAGGAAAGSCMDIENGTALSSDEIDALLEKISAAKLLKGGGKTIYDEAKEASINPLWSFGQAKKESNFGQAYANNPNSKYGAGKNMFGMDYSKKYKKEHMATPAWVWGGADGDHKVAQFKKWEYGLSEHMRLIRRAYLNPGGYAERDGKKVSEMSNEEKALAILHVYAPHSDGNNPDQYAENVLGWMQDWCNELGIDPNAQR